MWIFWKDLNKTGSASSEYQENEKNQKVLLELNRFLQPFLSLSVTLSAEGWEMNSDMEVAFLEADMYLLVQGEISFDLTEL